MAGGGEPGAAPPGLERHPADALRLADQRGDAHGIASAPPTFDPDMHVVSTNLGRNRGETLGLSRDHAGNLVPATAPDIGAYQS